MSDRRPRIGFVGLGKMGRPMVGQLAAAGFPLVVRDAAPAITTDVADAFGVESGADADAFADVEILILMLPNSAIVESVLEGPEGLVNRLPAGALVVDMGSSEPLRTRALNSRLHARGFAFCDAPVSGGVAGAERGSLAIMVGGTDDVVAPALPVLEVLGSRLVRVGPVGAGHAAKALNNLVSASTLAVTVEALHIAAAFGIDPDVFVDVLNGSTGRSNTSENKVRQFMLSGSYGSGFSLSLMVKDLGIAVSLAEDLRVPARVSREAVAVWRSVAPTAAPDADHTRMYEYLDAPPNS